MVQYKKSRISVWLNMNIEMSGWIAPNSKERFSLWVILWSIFIFHIVVKFSVKTDYIDVFGKLCLEG